MDKTSGGLKCWGSNSDGQLSDDTVTYSTTPLVIGFTGYTYAYDSTHKHAATSLSSGATYTYDANGNTLAPGATAGVTTRVENGVTYTQNYDAENRLISVNVTGQSLPTLFIYDGDGNLVKQIKPDNTKTLYVGGIYEVTKNSGGAETGTKTYYPAAGAMRDGSTLYYVLKDHLGSASVLTNSSGGIVAGADTRYYPFGEARFSTSSMVTDKLYTGQRQIAELGIYHYGARFYSPKLGRFLSADTIVPGYANPQNLNRFSYVINNPLRYTDPTGHAWDDGVDGGCSPCTQLPDPDDDEDDGDDLPDPDAGDTCDPVLGCENEDLGIYCDQFSCWSDVATDISGTYEDPAVYISLAFGGWASGLASDIGWMGLHTCLRVTACARVIAGTTGITVYRVWGGNPNQPGVNYSGPFGSSWSPIPPKVAERLFSTTYRNVAGLPNINNMGRFLSTGTINDISVVSRIQSATPISPNAGGLLEYIIYNAEKAVKLINVQGINPPY